MELFLIFFSIIFFFSATLGYGYIFLKITGKNNNALSIGEIGYLGFFVISFITLLFHFFIPLNVIFNTSLYSIGILFLFLRLKNFNLKNFKHYYFFILILFFSILMFIKYKPNEDFGYYHLPYITNLIYEKVIFGLSNLQLNQGWNSIWLNIKSTYHVAYLNYNGIFFSNIVFYLFTSLFLYELNMKSIKINNSIFIFSFTLFFLIFLNLKFSRINTYGLDVPSNYILIYVCILFFLYIGSDSSINKKFNIFEYLVLFSIFSISFRIINILILVLPLVILLKDKIPLTKIFKSKIFLFGVFFFVLFLSQQVIYTGCILIPNDITCISNLPWFDPNIIENFNTDTSKVNKSFQSYTGNLSREEYLANFNWVNNWFVRHKIELFEHIGTFVLPIILYIFLLKIGKQSDKFSYNFFNNYVLIFVLLSLLIWFFKAPVIRFGTIYIQSLILILTLTFLKGQVINLPKKNIVFLLIAVSFFINFIKNTNRILNDSNITQLFPIIPEVKYYTENYNDIKLSSPIANPDIAKSELCWNVQALCKMGGFNDLEILTVNNYILIKKKN